MSPLDVVLLLLTGAATGLFGALLGIGGGALMVPVLTLLFHVPMRVTIAASLLSVVAPRAPRRASSLRAA